MGDNQVVVQIWDIAILELIESGVDADSLKPELTIIKDSEEEAEKVVAILDNLIQMSSNSEIREGWVISTSQVERGPADAKELAGLFYAAEAEATR